MRPGYAPRSAPGMTGVMVGRADAPAARRPIRADGGGPPRAPPRRAPHGARGRASRRTSASGAARSRPPGGSASTAPRPAPGSRGGRGAAGAPTRGRRVVVAVARVDRCRTGGATDAHRAEAQGLAGVHLPHARAAGQDVVHQADRAGAPTCSAEVHRHHQVEARPEVLVVADEQGQVGLLAHGVRIVEPLRQDHLGRRERERGVALGTRIHPEVGVDRGGAVVGRDHHQARGAAGDMTAVIRRGPPSPRAPQRAGPTAACRVGSVRLG